ncbi:MAG: hypothetical protein J5982_00310 [Bacilli bacterium]|nr:hypothetical protein [Bacilli bacterium]
MKKIYHYDLINIEVLIIDENLSKSNFFKIDLNYYQIIIPEIEDLLENEFMSQFVMDSIKIFNDKKYD